MAEPVKDSVAKPARPSKLDPFKDYVLERMKQGVLNAVRIRRELAARGYDGGLTILRDFMAPHRPVYKAKTVRDRAWTAGPGGRGSLHLPGP